MISKLNCLNLANEYGAKVGLWDEKGEIKPADHPLVSEGLFGELLEWSFEFALYFDESLGRYRSDAIRDAHYDKGLSLALWALREFPNVEEICYWPWDCGREKVYFRR